MQWAFEQWRLRFVACLMVGIAISYVSGQQQQCSLVWPLTLKADAGWVPSFVQFLSLGQSLVKTHKVFLSGKTCWEK